MSLHLRVPGPLRPWLLAAWSWNRGRKKYGGAFEQTLQFLLESDAQMQSERAMRGLHEFLDRLRRESHYYDVPSSLDVSEMPILDKATVRRDHEQICWDSPFAWNKSSGTTGAPLKVPYNSLAYQKEYAYWWYHRSWGGVRRGDRIATIAGHPIVDIDQDRPPFWLKNPHENQLLFSSYHFRASNMPAYIEALNSFRPEFIHGYPSSVYALAKALLESGKTLDFQPKMIATASETTLAFQREAIERAFGCKLFIWYGNAEFCGHVEECPQGRLHAQTYHSHLRVLDENGRDVAPGEEGRIVATNWTNTAFPLINYDTKDSARVSKHQTCACGMGGTILDFIVGRVEDYVLTADGRSVGRLDHLFKDAKFVRHAQLEQKTAGELIIRIEREPGYTTQIEQIIQAEARARLGSDARIVFDYVDEIPREKSGKFRFVIQRLEKGALSAGGALATKSGTQV